VAGLALLDLVDLLETLLPLLDVEPRPVGLPRLCPTAGVLGVVEVAVAAAAVAAAAAGGAAVVSSPPSFPPSWVSPSFSPPPLGLFLGNSFLRDDKHMP